MKTARFGLAAGLLFAPAGVRAEWQSATIAGVGVHVYVPARAGAHGLMLGLHGCVQSHTVLRDLGNWETSADANGLVIALPAVPGGGVIAGCWDYYGAGHTRENRHNGAVLGLVEALKADASLEIDAARVYVAGLSSGAGQAAVLGCLAPDVFAGVGLAAGPAVGTASSDIGRVATDVATASALCRQLAGEHTASFETQLASIVSGTGDFLVAQGYAQVHAEMFASLYGATEGPVAGQSALPGHEPDGEESLYSDARGPRVSVLRMEGMGHAWPAGSGAGAEQQYVAIDGLSYPEYLAAFFDANARRGAAPRPPVAPPTSPSAEPPDEPESVDADVIPEGVPEVAADACVVESWVAEITATLPEHTARFETFPAGYGAADITYVELLNRHGVGEPFPLYQGADGHWYADPENVPAGETGGCEPVADEPEPAPEDPKSEVETASDSGLAGEPDAGPGSEGLDGSGGGCQLARASGGPATGWWAVMLLLAARFRSGRRARRPARSGHLTKLTKSG